MNFKDFQRQNYIVDTANEFTKRKISKRDFMRKMGMAGVGFYPLCNTSCRHAQFPE